MPHLRQYQTSTISCFIFSPHWVQFLKVSPLIPPPPLPHQPPHVNPPLHPRPALQTTEILIPGVRPALGPLTAKFADYPTHSVTLPQPVDGLFENKNIILAGPISRTIRETKTSIPVMSAVSRIHNRIPQTIRQSSQIISELLVAQFSHQPILSFSLLIFPKTSDLLWRNTLYRLRVG